MPVSFEFAAQVIKLRPLELSVAQMAARLRCTEAEIVEALGMLAQLPSTAEADPPTPAPRKSGER
jgi:hypothetical protein